MFRQITSLLFTLFCATLAVFSASAILDAQGAGRLVWLSGLIIGTVGALRSYADGWWWPIVLHTGSVIILSILLVHGGGGPVAVLGVLLHTGAGILWWIRPAAGPAATLGLAASSLGFAIFAIVFHWVCGGCFGVHGLMFAAVVLLRRRSALRLVPAAVLWRSAVAGVAVTGVVYIALTCVPSLTRPPTDRALLALLAEWQAPLASVQALPSAAAPGPYGVEIGAGSQLLEVFLAADQKPDQADVDAITVLATGGYRVRIATMGGATGARARAVAWTAAARQTPAQWATLLAQAQLPTPAPADIAATEALVEAAVSRTAFLDVRRLPAYVLCSPTGASHLTTLASLKGSP